MTRLTRLVDCSFIFIFFLISIWYSQYISSYPTEYIEDTAGAGDGFAAGFLAGQLRGYDAVKSAEIGNWIGALAALVHGDVEGYQDNWQLENFLNNKAFIER